MSVVLGIDPGSTATGYGLIQTDKQQHQYLASGCIRTNPKTPLNQRLYQIFSDIRELIQIHQPHEVGIEKIFTSKNASSALKLGQTRGAIITAIASYDLPIAEYSPRQVKLAITGYGAAEKNQVQQMMMQLLKLNETPRTLDESDALAIAICHAHSNNIALGI